jgi:hypothetical protein
MVNFSPPPGLEGLLDLDRQGVDIRPTLLRVLTDQYLQSPAHTAEQERHYTELALRLIEEMDITTRATVAARLAPHACAPRTIIMRLARDVLNVAEPVLLHSPLLTPADCEAIVNELGAAHAQIIARRGKPVTAELRSPSRAIPVNAAAAETIAGQPALGEAVAEIAPKAASAAALELCELFYAAGSLERRLILLSLDFVDWPAEQPPSPLQRADIWRLETGALRRNTPTVVRELEVALGISHQQARRIVEDEQGEPIVVAAKAMKMPADVLQRILLFMNPLVGQKVDRVYELAELYSEIGVEAAQRMVTILRGAEKATNKPDTRALYSAAENARRALSEVARTSVRRDTLHLAPALPKAEVPGFAVRRSDRR